jgi:D-alanyl-D-alanine carboxypeptidase
VSRAIFLVFLVFAVYGFWSFVTGFIGNDNIGAISNPLTVEGNALNNPNPSADEASNSVNTFVMSGQTTAIPISEITDTGYLKLVNREHRMSREPDRNLFVQAWPTVPVRATYITLHISALNAVSALFDVARNESSIGTLLVGSGYRNFSRQEQIYNNSTNRDFVLPPGHSEHHTGLGIDISAVGIGMFEIGNTAEGRWLADNSWKFGLILRYPENRKDVTGVAYEPWHFRYVGQPHAWYMWENDMVLEEYLEFLREIGENTATLNGREYTVLYQMPFNGMLQIPQNSEFTVSSDNIGGFIITSW